MLENQEKVIEVENLTQDYGHGRGVFDVTFSVCKGEVFGFLGPNGAGKSTTIRHIMGFSKAQSGQTRVLGMESFKEYYKLLKYVGYLPGEIALPEGLTGWEFIHMMEDLKHVHNKDRLKMLLERFKLDPIGETKKMSLGDKRKLAIVVAFMAVPDILILDEPTSGLDPVMQQVFIDFIKEEKKRGKTILLSSHMFNEVEATCDRIAIIKDGKIVSMFDTSKITHNENKNFIVKFKSKKDLEDFASKLPRARKNLENIKRISLKHIDQKDNLCVVAVNDKDINNLSVMLSNYNITSFVQVKFTLEDYFMQFYREKKDFGGIVWKKK